MKLKQNIKEKKIRIGVTSDRTKTVIQGQL